MLFRIPVTAIVTTLNEERNIARCLASLERFDEIIVVDSNSTDRTADIVRSFGIPLIPFTWNGSYPKKRQWVLNNVSLRNDHVFFIDADEEATSLLCDEIALLNWTAPGYFIRGLYSVNGKILRHGLHNKKLCLFDRMKIEFPVVDDLDIPGMGEIEGHYQPVLKKNIAGRIPMLRNHVIHYALEDRERYAQRHEAYADWKKGMILRNVHPKDPVAYRRIMKASFARIPGKSLIFFIYFYIWRLGFLEYKNNIAIYKEKVKYHIHNPN